VYSLSLPSSVTGDSGCAMDPAFIIRKPWIQDYFHGCVTSAWDVPLGVHTAFKTIFNASFTRSILDIGVYVSRRRFTGVVAVFCWYCHLAVLLLVVFVLRNVLVSSTVI
jgi:hypothetical protein